MINNNEYDFVIQTVDSLKAAYPKLNDPQTLDLVYLLVFREYKETGNVEQDLICYKNKIISTLS